GQVTVANDLPGGQRSDNGANAREQSRKTEEIVNYEISRSTKTEVTEGGRVNRISVAVLVDGTYGRNDKGEIAYQPRAQEELDRITALVRSAIGFDQKRGDQIEVVNLRFAEVPITPIAEPTGLAAYLQFTKDDVMHWIEILVMMAPGIVVVLLVVRPLVRRIIATDQSAGSEAPAAIAAGDAQVAIAGGETVEQIQAQQSEASKMIDIAQVKGQVHAQ